MGETVSITTGEPLDGRRHFKGKLSAVHDGAAEVLVDGQAMTVPLAAVKKAHVEFDFDKDKHPKKKHR